MDVTSHVTTLQGSTLSTRDFSTTTSMNYTTESEKFKKGFRRRSHEQISPGYEEKRVQKWEKAHQKRLDHQKKRSELKLTREYINGNIINGDLKFVQNQKATDISERPLFQSKRRVSFDNDPIAKRDHLILAKQSKNRLYATELENRPQCRRIEPARKHFSSDLKIGSNDIPSRGVLDNFRGQGY